MRLIDADELKRKMEDLVFYRGNIVIEIIDALHKVDECQTVDAEPVKHARWIDPVHGVYKCSNCRSFLDFEGVNSGSGDANYCPHCGAKMDEEKV